MLRINLRVLACLSCVLLAAGPSSVLGDTDAHDIIKRVWEQWRGLSSYSEMTMNIHRPDWDRTMSMHIWTEGNERSLVRVTSPKRDAGNGTLLIDKSMWTYSPKINRIIKIPSSMMNQSWMGSDFTNNDVSRSDDILDQYDHRLIGQSELNGIPVSVIESIPHEDASVVWGKEILHISPDNVVMKHEFYDQDGDLVKTLQTLDVAEMDGRVIATRQRMFKTESPEEWTEIKIDAARYDLDLDKKLFSRANLRNPRE